MDDDFVVISDEEYQRNREYSLIKKFIIIFLIVCIITTLVFGIYVTVNIETNVFITTIEPFDNNVERSIQQGNGLLIERIGRTVKLKNTGTYDVFPGLGTIIDHLSPNYVMVSINKTFLDIELNVSTLCINTTVYVNQTNTLTADNSIILLPNPWIPSLNSATAKVNETYIRNNLNLNTLNASTGLKMTLNPWNPTNGDTVLDVNQTYINANLNLSSLTQGSGILITSNQWNPSGSSATISIDENYINNNLNLGLLTAMNGLTMVPNPWNPATGNAVISLTQPFDQQGFMAVWVTTEVNITGVIAGNWSTSVSPAWSDGGFNASSGTYTVPSSGIYTVDSHLVLDTATTSVTLRINSVSTYIFYNVVNTGGIYFLTVSIPLNANDQVDIFAVSTRTVNGGSSGAVPWTTHFGLNKVST